MLFRSSQADYNRLLSTVPFEEDDKDPRTWFLDHNYIESMNDMFKKVNGKSLSSSLQMLD